jgi:hypothetical protein
LSEQRGFWGTLASGRTFADLNDRTGEAVSDNAERLMEIEQIIAVMTGLYELPAGEAAEKLRWYSETQSESPPQWCNDTFLNEVRERMRRLLGGWKATAFGKTMEVRWH